nr:hypothetical protein [Tanacetum cinerariifolium]
MVAILEKDEYNTDFHPMVDFITASPLRRNLKLRDEDGISSLPDTELFENLTLMGMSQFGQITHTHHYVGKGSETPTEPHHTPSPEADPSYLTTSSMPPPSFPTAPIPPVTQLVTTPIRQYTRRVRNAQSSTLPTVTDEPASLVRDVSEGKACPTESGFIADQDRETIAKSSTLPHDSAPRVTSPAVDEGSMQQTISELTDLYTSLQRQHSELLAKFQAQEVEILKLKERVKVLEDREGIAATRSGDDAPIKGRSIDEGEAATERTSDDSEELARVLTSIDAATVLVGGIDVPTGSGSIPTAGPPVVDIHTSSDVVPTASSIVATATVVTLYSRRKGKEVMVESGTLKKQRLQEQIDAQVARELEEQQERKDKRMTEQIARDEEDNYSKIYKFQSQQRRPWTKKQKKDYYMTVIRNNLGWKVKDLKGMTFEEIEAKFAVVWMLVKDFIPMGSKEEAERLKRKGFNLEQEKSKKQKTLEEVLDKEKSPEEIPEEKVKEMMQLVPIEEVYVQALQVKHPIIDWKVHIEGQRNYWKIIMLGGSSACYQSFVDLLKHLDREDLNQLWVLVKEYLSIRPASSNKEMKL